MRGNEKDENDVSSINNNTKKKSKMEMENKKQNKPEGGGRGGRGRGNSRGNNGRGGGRFGGRSGRGFNRGGRGNRHSNKKINTSSNDSTEKPNQHADDKSFSSSNNSNKNRASVKNKIDEVTVVQQSNRSDDKDDDNSRDNDGIEKSARSSNSGRGRGGRSGHSYSGRGRGRFNNNKVKNNKPPNNKENSHDEHPSKNNKRSKESRSKKKNHLNKKKQQHQHNEEDTSTVDDSHEQKHENGLQNGKGPLPFNVPTDPSDENDTFTMEKTLAHEVQNIDINDNRIPTKMETSTIAKEVSVTSSTKIKISNADDNESNKNGNNSKEPIYFDLLQRKDNSLNKTAKDSTINSKSNNKSNKNGKNDNKNDQKSKRKKKKKKNNAGSNGDSKEFDKALRIFNRSVRQCVDRSDPDTLHDLLHDLNNHCYTLNDVVLETLLKAYVVAAMFGDALYCLRNVVAPETLKINQTENILQCLPQNLRNSNAYTAADMMDALCIATKLGDKRAYFLRIVRGIALEFLEEATNARDRICSAPCERLVRAGVCLINVAFKRGKKASDLVVITSSTDKHNINGGSNSEHNMLVLEDGNRGIQAGDAVGILPYAGPYPMSAQSLDRNMIEATVTTVQPLVLRLQDKTNSALYAMLTMQENVYRIDKLANRMGFNRQLAASVTNATPYNYNDNNNSDDDNSNNFLMKKDAKRPAPELIRAITSMDVQQKKEEKDNLKYIMKQPQLTTTAAICARPVSFTEDENFSNGNDSDDNDNLDEKDYATREASRLAMEKYGVLHGLNSSQRLAVEGAVTNRLTLIQGPPGTGKTAVGIRILQHWTRISGGKPVLATSDSNIAVDNLVEGCANVGLRVVRLGRPEAIRPELLKFCIDRPQQNNNSSQQQLSSSLHPSSQSNYNSSGGYVSSAQAYKEKKEILKKAQVVCCTCIGSGSDILDGMIFERVLVDEATQATEPAVLVPLTRGCRQLVLVGDHCQLPPTVLSNRAEEEGLGVPLFSRMVACGVPPFMLDTQYRMHPCIAMFPSDLFYGGKLLNGVSAPERRPLAGFPWPREEFPVAFVPVPHGVEVDDGVSKLNEAEAAAACDAVAALLAGGQCTTSDIAVVTPYAAQVRLIRRLTRKLVGASPFVEVSSTDGFQGREKEAVVFSAVRSNNAGTVGFVSDWRRVNVSFTRARRALIVIGNDVCLRRGDPDTWMPWLAWADAHGINMDKPGVPRGRYEPEQLRRVRGGTTAAEMLKDVLARQQAQLKTAEQHLEKAERKSKSAHPQHQHLIGNNTIGEGNFYMGNSNAIMMGGIDNKALLEEDLAKLSNTDGCWDDSDDDDNQDGGGIHISSSRLTLATMSTANTKEEEQEEELQDAWDL